MAMAASIQNTTVHTPRRGAILVVEDREDVRQGLAQLLELHGFLVADASDGRSALERLMSDENIALVLLDLILPGEVDGRDIRICQRAHPRLAAIPTVIVTAEDVSAAEREDLSPTAWLEKPFRFDDLLEIVKRHVVREVPAMTVAD